MTAIGPTTPAPLQREHVVVVNEPVLARQREVAQDLRSRCTARGILVVNLVSSPGAGKTSLLEATARHWKNRYRLAVLVGDLATDRDAQRLAPLMPTAQLTTGGACHLEAPLVARGFMGMVLHYSLFDQHFGFKLVRASRKRAIDSMVDIFLHGLKTQ